MPTGRPDWFGTIVAAGKYDTTYIPIALDVDGFITATIKGKYDTDAVLKTIAVDSSGIMKANLSVQDLDFLTVRPAYGEAVKAYNEVDVSATAHGELIAVPGKGIILGGIIHWIETSVDTPLVKGIIECEDVIAIERSLQFLYYNNMWQAEQMPLYAARWDPTNKAYTIGISPGTTFETKLEIRVYNPYAEEITVECILQYALVP